MGTMHGAIKTRRKSKEKVSESKLRRTSSGRVPSFGNNMSNEPNIKPSKANKKPKMKNNKNVNKFRRNKSEKKTVNSKSKKTKPKKIKTEKKQIKKKKILTPTPIKTEIDKKKENNKYSSFNTKKYSKE